MLRRLFNSKTMSKAKELPLPPITESAVFGMGCFWSPDCIFPGENGVLRTSVGYAGGKKEAPTYRAIGDHTEVIRVEYDPERTSYEKMLAVFWQRHDPTVAQKCQYMSMILYADDKQKSAAESSFELQKAKRAIVTRLDRLENFYLAEDYHQKFHLKEHPAVLDLFGLRGALIDSSLAAKLSAFVTGFGTEEELERITKQCEFTQQQHDTLKKFIGMRQIMCGT